MNYNRTLHTDDYNELTKWLIPLREFEQRLAKTGAPYRKDHQHREWEYGLILRQLEELNIPKDAKILDTGSGASYFPPYLKVNGYSGLVVSDSMDYGDITDWLRKQCWALDIEIPMLKAPVEKLGLEDDTWDVVMCISTIEHLDVRVFEQGMKELFRVCKPGGYIFITSDFFESEARALQSPCLGMQHTRFNPKNIGKLLNDAFKPGYVEFVGNSRDSEPDFSYKGDFVNNYSFVNLCLRKPLPL